MKLMKHDRKGKELSFNLEKHEIVDDMLYRLYFNGPKSTDLSVGPVKVNSESVLKFEIPDALRMHLGMWTFWVIGLHPLKPDYVVASGYTHGMHIVCHQALTMRY